MQLRRDGLEYGLRDARHRTAVQIRVPEAQRLWCQLVGTVMAMRVPEHRERVQAPPGRGARDVGERGDLADREAGARVLERADDVQSARERLHEIRVARARWRVC